MAIALTLGSAGAADAELKTSPPVGYPNGALLTATAGLQRLADWDGCTNYNSAANISKRPTWIKNVTHFHANGIGATVGGVSINADGSDGSIEWTNNNGQLASYLSGNVCTNFLTWSLSMNVTGSSLQFGTVRTAGVGI
jgi:hypothetical protein